MRAPALVLAVLLLGGRPGLGPDDNAFPRRGEATATRPPRLPTKKWEFSASAYTYFVPDSDESDDYVQPTFTADRGWLHLEARYNYEALDTGSAWLGFNFAGGKNGRVDLHADDRRRVRQHRRRGARLQGIARLAEAGVVQRGRVRLRRRGFGRQLLLQLVGADVRPSRVVLVRRGGDSARVSTRPIATSSAGCSWASPTSAWKSSATCSTLTTASRSSSSPPASRSRGRDSATNMSSGITRTGRSSRPGIAGVMLALASGRGVHAEDHADRRSRHQARLSSPAQPRRRRGAPRSARSVRGRERHVEFHRQPGGRRAVPRGRHRHDAATARWS